MLRYFYTNFHWLWHKNVIFVCALVIWIIVFPTLFREYSYCTCLDILQEEISNETILVKIHYWKLGIFPSYSFLSEINIYACGSPYVYLYSLKCLIVFCQTHLSDTSFGTFSLIFIFWELVTNSSFFLS